MEGSERVPVPVGPVAVVGVAVDDRTPLVDDRMPPVVEVEGAVLLWSPQATRLPPHSMSVTATARSAKRCDRQTVLSRSAQLSCGTCRFDIMARFQIRPARGQPAATARNLLRPGSVLVQDPPSSVAGRSRPREPCCHRDIARALLLGTARPPGRCCRQHMAGQVEQFRPGTIVRRVR